MSNTKPENGRTFHLEETRAIPLPVDVVFPYAADFGNSEFWDPGVDKARKVSEGPIGVGTRYQLEGSFGPRTIQMEYEITLFEPNERVVLEGGGTGFRSVDDMQFTPDDGSTTIHYTADITLHNSLRFLGPLMNWPLKRMGERALDGLVSTLTS